MTDSFRCRAPLQVGGKTFEICRLDALEKKGLKPGRLPFAIQVLLENVLRHEDGASVKAEDVEALASWDPRAKPSREIAFTPARVLMQDFTGVPAVVDLAAMRDAMRRMGGDPARVNPLLPAELVIDHSVQVDAFGTPGAFRENAQLELARNRERYAFLRWGQKAFSNFQVVPPDTGICHQVNLEHLARVVMTSGEVGKPAAFLDTVVGTDSHTTMINGLGVLGWGVGGIEAEAAMLGQPISMLIPEVVGVRLAGRLREGSTATDLVLRVTEMLRKHGVVGKLVEFFGPGVSQLPLADRATIANMAPEYGATCGLFPIDAETLRYLELTGRPKDRVALVEAYAKAQGFFHTDASKEAEYSAVLDLDLASVVPSLAGPKRPQDRVSLPDVKRTFGEALPAMLASSATSKKGGGAPAASDGVKVQSNGDAYTLRHGSVVIAAITSCTNTSNPSVMVAAGLLAKKAVERGLSVQPWVKTSLAPGSKVVTDYLRETGLAPFLEKLRFHLVGYGCTTCIGNSGPLPAPVAKAIEDGHLVAAAVLSGNRNFEGRVHAQVRANYLASPPLVVAYALAGRVDVDLEREPLGTGADGKPVFLRDVWPTQAEVGEAVGRAVRAEMFAKTYADVFAGDAEWRALPVPAGDTYAWDAKSTYVKNPPYFEGMEKTAAPFREIMGARALAVFGDSITTDHISPAGSIKPASPAGRYLQSHGVKPEDFNSYGARRGNHEVMMRGTFANVRIKNALVPGVEGGETIHFPEKTPMSIFDAAMRYREEGVPLVVLAGKEYGSGSSRDWAAKGPMLLGVRAVIAESFERIHRSNLVGMGIVPLELAEGTSVASLGLTGHETFDLPGLAERIAAGLKGARTLAVRARREDGTMKELQTTVRIDTPQEVQYVQHGGILQCVLRQLLAKR